MSDLAESKNLRLRYTCKLPSQHEFNQLSSCSTSRGQETENSVLKIIISDPKMMTEGDEKNFFANFNEVRFPQGLLESVPSKL